MVRTFSTRVVYQGSLGKGEELIQGLIAVMKERMIVAGAVTGMGALTEARIGYFDGRTKKYEEKVFRENMEIAALKGNISLKDGQVFPHLHAVLSGRDFSAVGGHLFSATVYAFEFEITPFEGEPFRRVFDEETGLFLWKEIP